jgi:uroporphyrinogen decarboxylase
MHKKERVRAAISGREVDYIPAGFWFHFPKDQFFGDEAVKAHLDFYQKTDVDVLKIMNENRYELDVDIQKASDWLKIKPMPLASSFYQDELDIVKKILDRIGDRVYTLITVHGVYPSAFHTFKHPGKWFSENNMVETHIMENPDAVTQGLQTIAESLTAFAQECLRIGVDGIYYGALGGESYRSFSGELFEQVIKPNDLAVLNALKKEKGDVFIHICKDQVNFEPYADYPGDVFNWATYDNDLSLEEGRVLFQKTVLGGLDDRSGVMVDGTKADIQDEVKNIISRFGKKSFILGADCTLPTDIPIDNICAAIEAARSI